MSGIRYLVCIRKLDKSADILFPPDRVLLEPGDYLLVGRNHGFSDNDIYGVRRLPSCQTHGTPLAASGSVDHSVHSIDEQV